MTEAEWLTGTDWELLLAHLGPAAGARKRRLFGCACCRGLWHLLSDARSRAAVEVAERYADGQAGEEERQAAQWSAQAVLAGLRVKGRGGDSPQCDAAWAAAGIAGRYGGMQPAAAVAATWPRHAPDSDYRAWFLAGQRRLADLVRELFGSPFRPPALDPAWLTFDGGLVPVLARKIYDERAFDLLPVLGDALEDAGCDRADVLGHCRGPGPHVRGCWVIDRILGKG
jgi:hypothetical protein